MKVKRPFWVRVEGFVRRYVRYTGHECIAGATFKVELWPGDDAWSPSLHIEHWWMGRRYWRCWFFPSWNWQSNAANEPRSFSK